MKKIYICLLLVLLLTGCTDKKEKESPLYLDMPSSYKVDMSEYNGLKAFDHQFVGVGVEEIFNALDNKGSGIFYLGYETCPFCNETIALVNEVAKETNQTIYYVNVYALEPDFLGQYDKFLEVFDNYLLENDAGEKALYTPLYIFIYNGEIVKFETGLPDYWDTINHNDKQSERLKNAFRKEFNKFVD